MGYRTLIILAAMVVVSACNSQTASLRQQAPASSFAANPAWDDLIMAETTAKVGNSSMIMMR